MAEVIAIEKGLASSDPATAVVATRKAQELYNAKLKDVAVREPTGQKAYTLDPQTFLGNGSGFRDKQTPQQLSYEMLRKMGRTPLIRSIIDTRIEQVAAFAVPQSSKYATGFKIVKKRPWGLQDKEPKLTLADEREIERITEFMLNCGSAQNQWHGDTFEEHLRKTTRDSLVLDQEAFEVIRGRRSGIPVEFVAADGATFRFAETAGIEEQLVDRRRGIIHMPSSRSILPDVNGYRPTIVQIHDNQIVAEFYPWELSMGIRNLHTDSSLGGYGISELEDLITVVTAMLDADAYNRNFFKLGSAPKGFLKVKGTVDRGTLNEFRTEWRMLMAGVQNSHRTPVLPADVDWVDLGHTNRDMEYSHFSEYLLKLTCSLYKIDPEEIGFKTGTGADGGAPAFEGNNAARIKFGRDKGLYPTLKGIAARRNKFIVNGLNPQFELQFVGLDALTEADELEQDVKALGAYMTFNEIRKRRNLAPVEGGDIIGNAIYTAAVQQAAQQKMMEQQAAQGAAGTPDDGGNPAADAGRLTDPTAEGGPDDESNPFLKAFHDSLTF